MKNIFAFICVILFLCPQTFAAVSNFKTYTPTSPYNGYYKYLPPPPPSINNQNYQNRFWQRRNYYNSNNYNYPYGYYPQRRSVFGAIGDFFGRGKMTGYTDSNFDNFPYMYQQQIPNADYYFDTQSGSSVKIID